MTVATTFLRTFARSLIPMRSIRLERVDYERGRMIYLDRPLRRRVQVDAYFDDDDELIIDERVIS